jgi:hypothetical protein
VICVSVVSVGISVAWSTPAGVAGVIMFWVAGVCVVIFACTVVASYGSFVAAPQVVAAPAETPKDNTNTNTKTKKAAKPGRRLE